MSTLQTVQSTLNILREKFPLFLLTLHTTVATHAFQPCGDNKEHEVEFWVYYPILCFICFMWELVHGWISYTTKYPHGTKRDHTLFSVLTAFIGVWSFVVTSYYMNLGVPFKCIFSYDPNVAAVVFYLSTAIITLISYLEHLHWKKLVKEPGATSPGLQL